MTTAIEWREHARVNLVALGKAAKENERLRESVVELLEILRQLPPGNLGGRDEAAILRAMYAAGILLPPTETVKMMTVPNA